MGVTVLIAVCYGAILLFFDQFVFLAPYFTVYMPSGSVATLALDLILSALTAIVSVVSIKLVRLVSAKPRRIARMGFLGVLAAIFAGACPCYYLVPLLAVAGSFGGALGAVGILMNGYQFPIKLASVIILLCASYGLERSFRMTCNCSD
jgi:hypothetical protein